MIMILYWFYTDDIDFILMIMILYWFYTDDNDFIFMIINNVFTPDYRLKHITILKEGNFIFEEQFWSDRGWDEMFNCLSIMV